MANDVAVLPGGFKSVKNRWLAEFEREQRENEKQQRERELHQQQAQQKASAVKQERREGGPPAQQPAEQVPGSAKQARHAAGVKGEPGEAAAGLGPKPDAAGAKAEPGSSSGQGGVVPLLGGCAPDAPRLGLVDLQQYNTYAKLLAAVKKMARGSLSDSGGLAGGGPRLVYRDTAGDWMLLQADEPFDDFRACANSLMLV